jgi:hypothetical protein
MGEDEDDDRCFIHWDAPYLVGEWLAPSCSQEWSASRINRTGLSLDNRDPAGATRARPGRTTWRARPLTRAATARAGDRGPKRSLYCEGAAT